jgi:hypothetical protein
MKRIFMLFALLLVLTVPVMAQTPKQVSATIADFGWLVGSWEGHMVGRNGTADLTFNQPKAGTLTGMMRLVDNDKVIVIELLSIIDTPTGPEMRFRHFSPSLEAYEAQFRQTMRLFSHSSNRDVFENATPYDAKLMSTQPRTTQFIRHGADEFVGHSDIIGDDGKPAVVEAIYRRKTN